MPFNVDTHVTMQVFLGVYWLENRVGGEAGCCVPLFCLCGSDDTGGVNQSRGGGGQMHVRRIALSGFWFPLKALVSGEF